MAAGRGTRMRSRTPKVLHPLCGRPLAAVAGRGRARGRRRADRRRARRPDSEDVQRVLPPGRRGRDPARAGRHGRRRAERPRAARRRREDVIVLSGDHPLLDAGLRARARRAPRQRRRRRDRHHARARGPGPVRAHRARRRTGDIERIVETKAPGRRHAGGAGDQGDQPRHLRLRGRAAARGARRRSRPDNAQGELYLGDALPIMRAAGQRVVAHLTEDEAAGLGINTRADLAAVQAQSRQRRILERHMLAGVTITDPGLDRDRRRRPDRRGHGDRALHVPARPGRDRRAAAASGPMTTLTDCVLGDDVSVLHSYLEGCEVLERLHGRAVRPPAPGHDAARAREGRHVRRDQELRHRRGHQDPPPLLHRRRRRRARAANIGAGNITANYDGQRKHRTVIGSGRPDGRRHRLRRAGDRRRRRVHWRRSVITDDVPGGRARASRGPARRTWRAMPRTSSGEAEATAEDNGAEGKEEETASVS